MNIINMIGTIRSITTVNDTTKMDRQREIITKLKFIGTFQAGEKIDVNNLRIEDKTLFTPLKRLFFGEGRDKTFNFLSLTIERSIEIIQNYVLSDRISERIYCSNLINDLFKAVVGLKNIQETYREDKMFVCNIDILIENVDAKLTEIKERFPDIMTIKPTIYSIENDSSTTQSYPDTHGTYKDFVPPFITGSPHLNTPCVTSYSPENNHVFKPSSYDTDNKKEQKQ
jgi:hypothetical protein